MLTCCCTLTNQNAKNSLRIASHATLPPDEAQTQFDTSGDCEHLPLFSGLRCFELSKQLLLCGSFIAFRIAPHAPLTALTAALSATLASAIARGVAAASVAAAPPVRGLGTAVVATITVALAPMIAKVANICAAIGAPVSFAVVAAARVPVIPPVAGGVPVARLAPVIAAPGRPRVLTSAICNRRVVATSPRRLCSAGLAHVAAPRVTAAAAAIALRAAASTAPLAAAGADAVASALAAAACSCVRAALGTLRAGPVSIVPVVAVVRSD